MNLSTYGYIARTPSAIGILKITTTTLHNRIREFREQVNYHHSFTFGAVRDHNLKLYKQLIDAFFTIPHTYFAAYVGPSSIAVGTVISNSLAKNENIVVFSAQHLPEQEAKDIVKKKLRRDALFGIYPASPRESSELQVAQVLLGVIAYACLLHAKDPLSKNAKFRLVKHLQRHLNTDILARSNTYYLRFKRRFSVEIETKKERQSHG